MKSDSPFFIVGTQRSGTTLLRLILNSHSLIAVPEEATFLMPLLKRRYLQTKISGEDLQSLINYLRLNPQFSLWSKDYSKYFDILLQKKEIHVKELINDLFTIYAHYEGKKIWGDKTPSFFRKIDILYTLFPNAKFIHIVRDGRDVFNSWRKIDASKNNAPVVAMDWSYKLYEIEKSFKKIPDKNKITIRYEDLLDEPEKVLLDVCLFLGVEYESEMLNFYKKSKKYIGKHHSSLIFCPITDKNKFKWKKELTPQEISSFILIARKFLKKYNYNTQTATLNISTIIFLLKNILIGLPLRLFQVLITKSIYEKALKKGQPVHSILVGDKPNDTTD